MPYAEFGKTKKVLACHEHHTSSCSVEMEQAKGGVVCVAFKTRQELSFDLHFDLLNHADRSPSYHLTM
jgi:hypothetical protein